jgi:hypothetical protein
MCGRSRPNEAFCGGNHRRHLCRECARHPQRHQREKEQSLLGMLLDQSNISPKNIKMAATWDNDDDPEIATLAKLVVDIGRLHPRKRKRAGRIHRSDPALFQRMIAAGLVGEWCDDTDGEEPSDGPDAMPGEPDASWSSLSDDDIPF